MSYRIEFVPSAERAFKKLESRIQKRIIPEIDALSANPRPHGVEKLAGRQNRYRIRVGDYRIIYLIEDSSRVITVAVVRHRREAYR